MRHGVALDPKWGLLQERTGVRGTNAARYPIPTMDFKRIFRGPLLYIVIAVIVVWVGSSLLTGSGFQQVTTQEGLRTCARPGADREDRRQRPARRPRRSSRAPPAPTASRSSSTTWHRAGQEIVNAVDSAYSAGKREVRRRGPAAELAAVGQRLPRADPAARPLLLVPAVEHAGRRQPRHAVRQVEARSSSPRRPRRSPSRTSRAPTRPSRSSTRSRTSSRTREVPGGRRPHPEGRAAVRPSRNRQDPARPRGRR